MLATHRSTIAKIFWIGDETLDTKEFFQHGMGCDREQLQDAVDLLSFFVQALVRSIVDHEPDNFLHAPQERALELTSPLHSGGSKTSVPSEGSSLARSGKPPRHVSIIESAKAKKAAAKERRWRAQEAESVRLFKRVAVELRHLSTRVSVPIVIHYIMMLWRKFIPFTSRAGKYFAQANEGAVVDIQKMPAADPMLLDAMRGTITFVRANDAIQLMSACIADDSDSDVSLPTISTLLQTRVEYTPHPGVPELVTVPAQVSDDELSVL
jgi:hypothetical protein